MKIVVKTFCIILCSVVLAHADQGTGVKASSGLAPLYLKNSTFDTKEIDYSLSGTKIQTGSQLGVCDNNPSVPVGNIFSLNMSIAKSKGSQLRHQRFQEDDDDDFDPTEFKKSNKTTTTSQQQ